MRRLWFQWIFVLSIIACGSGRSEEPAIDSGQDAMADAEVNGRPDLAALCEMSSECTSGLCVPDPMGSAAGSCAGPCSAVGDSVCTSSANGCLHGWFRWQLTNSSPIYCRCTPSDTPDDVGGGDTDCDAVIDEDAG